MIVCLDTSALLKLYLNEEDRELVVEAVEAAEVAATSTVAYAEARAGLARRLREGDFTEEEHRQSVSELDRDWGAYEHEAVSNRLAHLAGEMVERHALRGFDDIHLANAKRFEERFDDLRFLAFDDRLTDAAKAASMLVYPSET